MFGKKEDKTIPVVEGQRVSLNQAAAGSVRADEVSLEQSACQNITADRVSVNMGAVAFSKAAESNIENATAGVIVGDRVSAQNTSSIFLVAKTVNGNVRTLFDQRSALALGLGFAVALTVLRFVRGTTSSSE